VTDSTVPPSTCTEISVLTGTSFLPPAGLIVTDTAAAASPPAGALCSTAACDGAAGPPDGGVLPAHDAGDGCCRSSLPHAARASGATTANATIAARRLLTMLSPFSRSGRTSCLTGASRGAIPAAGVDDGSASAGARLAGLPVGAPIRGRAIVSVVVSERR
jgi:hypothetical protein